MIKKNLIIISMPMFIIMLITFLLLFSFLIPLDIFDKVQIIYPNQSQIKQQSTLFEKASMSIMQTAITFSQEQQNTLSKQMLNSIKSLRVLEQQQKKSIKSEKEQQKVTQTHQSIQNQQSQLVKLTSDKKINQHQQQLQQQKSTYSRITSYNKYIESFNSAVKKIPYSQIFNATNILFQSDKTHKYKQLCQNQEPCQFFYYIISPIQKRTNDDVKTIFIVSGMHGNQYLGPMTLLYGLKHFDIRNDCRIIIFPIANPSGFTKNQRVTYPTYIDPNRDFPIQSYKTCYQSASTMIIDHIYRTYSIQLTLGLHNGRSQIGYNWGTIGQFTNSHTKDYVIYHEISQMLRYYGGSNQKIKMQQFKIGTMNQVIYPASGTFDDWAYAASWYPKKTNSQTFACQYKQYPTNMTNGLVFLFQLGPFDVKQILFGSQIGVNIQPKSKSIFNGYISRSIRMIKNIFMVVNPQLIFKFTEDKIFFKLEGCKTGEIQNILFTEIQVQNSKVFYSQQQKIKLNLTNNNMSIIGNVNPFQIKPIILQLNQSLVFEQLVQTIDQNNKKNLILKKMKKFHDRLFNISYTLTCDKQWYGKGNTNFAKGRKFQRVHQIKLIQSQNQHILQSQSYSTMNAKNYYQSVDQALKSFSFTEQNNSTKQYFLPEEDFQEKGDSTMILVLIIGPVLIILLCGVFIICRQIRKQVKNQRKKQQNKITSKSKNKQSNIINQKSKSEDTSYDNDNDNNIKINSFIYEKIGQNNQSFISLHQPQPESSSYQLQQQQTANPSKNYHHKHKSSNKTSVTYNSKHLNWKNNSSHKHQQFQQQQPQQRQQKQKQSYIQLEQFVETLHQVIIQEK